MQSIKEGNEEKSDNSNNGDEIVIQPQVKFVNCPIRIVWEYWARNGQF
ncbi:MAG: hypothetical protein ACM3X1_06280 [Ignavibacteriales bacterium]